MKIYLDACCLNRPFDDQTQDRIRLEAEAVERILARCESGEWTWVSSEVVLLETSRNPDPDRRQRVLSLAKSSPNIVGLNPDSIERARALEKLGFRSLDAIHLAVAESARCGLFLTTDDQLIRTARRHHGMLGLIVRNPLSWLEREAIQ